MVRAILVLPTNNCSRNLRSTPISRVKLLSTWSHNLHTSAYSFQKCVIIAFQGVCMTRNHLASENKLEVTDNGVDIEHTRSSGVRYRYSFCSLARPYLGRICRGALLSAVSAQPI